MHTELGRAVSRVLGRVAWDGKWGQVSPALFQIYSAENAWNVSEHDPLPRWLAGLVLVTWPRCNYTGTVTGCRPQSSEERAGAGRRIVTPYNGAFVPPLRCVSSVHTMAVSHVSIFSLVNTEISEESQSQERTVHYNNTNGERTDTFNLVDEDRSEKISASLGITLI